MSPVARIARQIRDVLEDALEPGLASAVFFDALNGPGGVPESRTEAVTFVRGALREALGRRTGAEEASRLVTRILGRIDPSSSGSWPPREEEPTRALPTDTLPVEVAVVGASTAFASRLLTALGPARVNAIPIAGLPALRSAATAAVVVVDATDLTAIPAPTLAAALRRLPPTTVRVLWGAELPYGQGIQRATKPDDPVVLMLPLAAGIEPLLDVVRSRRVEL